MSLIKKIQAFEILDSRGNPTIEVEVTLMSGSMGRASAPSGASTGSREALELRDQDAKRYLGKGVQKAVQAVNGEIASALNGLDAQYQQVCDEQLIMLDHTPSKGRLGANAMVAVSLAIAKAAANEKNTPLYRFLNEDGIFTLPVPMMNIINGGAHAHNNVDIQELMIVPLGMDTFADALRAGVEIFHQLKNVLQAKKLNTNVGDEGGFAPDLASNASALEMILQAIERAGYQPGQDIYLGLDVASNELFDGKNYHLRGEHKILSLEAWTDYLVHLVDHYPIITIEDGMAENDWHGWRLLTERLGNRIQLVGDDVFVTNTALLQKGISEHIANAILIKPNQIGTLTETLAAIRMAQHAGYNSIVSHRSGETEDTTIADIAVAMHTDQIKTGSLCRSERIAKYNRLLHIEYELGHQAHYAGRGVFSRQWENQLEKKYDVTAH